MKKTLVLGASMNPSRASNRAVAMLKKKNFPLVAVGAKEGIIHGEKILTGFPIIHGIHTITLYLGKKNQEQFYEYILSLKPERIIFNPGAENNELYDLASSQGIEVLEACTLIMLSSGHY